MAKKIYACAAFGLTENEMRIARESAVLACQKYGYFTAEELARFVENPWNDHVSVQAAIETIKMMKRIHDEKPWNTQRYRS